MLMIIYRLITIVTLAFVVWNILTDKKVKDQMNGAILIIPLLLRALMIK